MKKKKTIDNWSEEKRKIVKENKSNATKLRMQNMTDEEKEKFSSKFFKKVSIDNVEYVSINDASKKLNIHRCMIMRRLNSTYFPDYIRL
jgi:hypothetical protein